jgi:hypothetical protein
MSPRHPPNQHAPLLAAFGLLTMVYSWLLEVLVLLGHRFSGGEWPAPAKHWVIGGVVVLATVYHVALRKDHRRFDRIVFDQKLTARQILVATCFLMAWVFLGVWLACGPPGPEFKPK